MKDMKERMRMKMRPRKEKQMMTAMKKKKIKIPLLFCMRLSQSLGQQWILRSQMLRKI